MAKLSKSELGPLARETIDLLKSGGSDLLARADAIAGYPSSNQVEYIEAVRVKAKELDFKSDPVNISALFQRLIEKVEFNNRTTHKLLKSVFECATAIAGEQSDTVSMNIYLSISRLFESRGGNAKNAVLLDFRGISEIRGFVRGFDLALMSDVHGEEVMKTRSLWTNFLPEMASRDSIPLTKESMQTLIGIIDSASHEFPASVRLCRYPLSIAIDKPLGAVSHTSIGAEFSSVGESKNPRGNKKEVVAAVYLPEISSLLDGFASLVAGLSDSFEKRLSSQKGIIDKLKKELEELVSENDFKNNEIFILSNDKSMLKIELAESKSQFDLTSSELNKVEDELNKYRARHDAINQSSEDRERDAVLRTKRELVDKQLTILVSIRDCLSRLVASEVADRSALQAASNFNNFTRFLRHEKYISPDQISSVDIPDVNRGA